MQKTKSEGDKLRSVHAGKTDVEIPVGNEFIRGTLTIPQNAKAIVVFAHGSGSGRFSPRNTYVAQLINTADVATLLIDLLTANEAEQDEYTGEYRFDVQKLAGRLLDATQWLKCNSQTQTLRMGYFGASTGAAAALIASAQVPVEVKAVVSRGGRPDLAKESLTKVRVPTLLIVGGKDTEVLRLNQEALRLISAEKKLEVISGATHLFEEPGKLEEAAALALDWFKKYL
ncbi:MAG: dienelactone hydrolase family protein [Candidatus Bathyarchaeia archaeon]